MGLGGWIKGVDALSRIETILRWLGLYGWAMTILSLLWAYLLAVPLVWWPVVAMIAVGLFIHLKAAAIHLKTKQFAFAQEHQAEKFAAAVAAAVRIILEKQKEVPKHHVIELGTGRLELTGAPIKAEVRAAAGTITGEAVVVGVGAAYLSLGVAMQKAYEATIDGPLAEFARGLNNSPEEILNWYAFAAFEHLPIYGKRPPSNILELIPPEQIATRLNFEGGAIALRGTWDAKPAYTELNVRLDEFEKFLEYLTTPNDS